MRTPGPNEVPPSLSRTPEGAGLKTGALVVVVVRGRAEAQTAPAGTAALYRVSIGARAYTASIAGLATASLEPGTVLKARVERAGDSLILRVPERELGEGPAAALSKALSAAALPNDAAARAAFAALLREGMAPEPRALARVRRAALRDEAEGGDRAGLAAKMEAKGIPAESAALEALAAAADGRSGSQGWGTGEGAGEGAREDPGSASEGRPATDAQDIRALEVPDSVLPQVLASLLQELAFRAGGGGKLALFNHLRGPEGSWLILPFRFALDAVDFTGSFRILLPYVRGGLGLFEAGFTASSGPSSADWSFFVNFGGGGAPSLRIERPEGVKGPRFDAALDKLAEALAPLSCALRSSRGGEDADGPMGGLDLDA